MLCFATAMPRTVTTTPLTEAELQRWKLLAPFRQALAAAVRHQPLPASWTQPQRLLQLSDYLALFLFGLLNPVVHTMRGLCAASQLDRVHREVCSRPVSLGSFSETQHVLEPALLEAVFTDLQTQVHGCGGDPRLATQPWQIVDSTLWAALPRMHWALWRTQGVRQQAVRLHVGFHLLDDKPVRAVVTEGKRCERAVWRQQWVAGAAYVGDRYYGEDYHLLAELTAQGGHYVVRLRDAAVVTVQEELALSAADRAAGVVRHAWVTLGARPRGRRVRVVWVQTPQTSLQLVTNQTPVQLSAELVALLYRYRWQVELFFRWLKCILGQRHWLAESRAGVTTQVYLALIAALLLQLFSGQRPTRRTLELIQWSLLGWASAAELHAGLARELARRSAQKPV